MANRNQPPFAVLPLPTADYDVQYLNNLVRLLNLNFNSLKNPGDVRVSTITITDLPTASAGLPAGSVWNDAGTLKIV